MAYFEWAKDMVIDHGPIDADHMALVDLVNRLHDATSEGAGHQVIGEILEHLVRYTLEHFGREEALMAQAGFPDLERHRQMHKEFIDSMNAMVARYEGGSSAVAAQVSRILRDWLSLHIRRSDKALLPYLRQRPA